MTDVRVSAENRPSIGKYVAYSTVGFVLVGAISGLLVQNSDNPLLGLFALAISAILTIGILFLMIQSLIEEWFAAAEVVDDGPPEGT